MIITYPAMPLNRLIFRKVIDMSMVSCFLTHSVVNNTYVNVQDGPLTTKLKKSY